MGTGRVRSITEEKGALKTEKMVAKQGRQKIAILLVAVTSAIPFIPAISEEFVFDDLPAVARNNDLTAANPTPIFLVYTTLSLELGL